MYKLYSGWGTLSNGEYVDFNSNEIRNLIKLGDGAHTYYSFEYLDKDKWIEVESLEPPDVVMAEQRTASLVDKVRKEVDELREDGLQEVDVKMSVLQRYGQEIYDLIFDGE